MFRVTDVHEGAGVVALVALCLGAMRYVITIATLILTLAILAGLKGAQIAQLIGFGKQMQALGPPPEAVNSAAVQQEDWEQTLSAVATVVSSKGVALSNDAAGVVSKVNFESGASVKLGQPLVEIDARVERAQLESLQARLQLATQSLERTQTLLSSKVSTQAELDAQSSAVKGLVADVKALEAQIERKTVRAPFSGRLGIRAVNLGQYLAPGTTLTVLESADSVFVDFTLPQQALEHIQVGRAVRVRAEADLPPIAEGQISAFDSSVNPVTRALTVRASVPNKEAVLRTGMFVNVEVLLPERTKVLVVPLTAVVRAAYGDSVFLVEPKADAPKGDGPPPLVAQQQFVRLGASRGDFVAVLDGVSAGQEVVSAGAFKLRNGSPISIKNEVGQTPSLTPHPANR
jgi:membrane fusion protein (multidrug efflux system)